MGIRTVPFQRLIPAETGIIASGVTTNAGTWSPDVNIGAYLTSKSIDYPSDATGFVIAIVNTNSAQQWAGIRKSGAAVNHALHDQYARSTSHIFVPCTSSESLQFYAENITNINFYVVGIVDDSVVWHQPSSAFPFILRDGSGNWADRNITTPLQSTLIFGWQGLNPASRIRNNGETHEPDAFDSYSTFKLPFDNNIEIKSFVDMPYVGYFQSGVTQPAWRTESFTPATGAWTKAPVSYPGKSFVHITSNFGGGSNQLLFRPASGAGQSFNWGTVRNGKNQWVPLDDNGEFEYFVTAGDAITTIWIDAIVDNYSEGVAAVTGPATIQAGVAFNITSSTFGGPIVLVEVEDALGNVINITPSATSLTVPEPTSGTDYVLFGDITITLYSATKQASFTSELLPGTGMAVTTMGVQHVGPGNISHGWPVPLSEGDQVYYPAANSTVVYEDGRFSTNNVGEWTIFAIYEDGFAESAVISSTAVVVPPVMPADTTATVSAGATVLGAFAASAGDAPTYTMGGTNAALFSIDSSTAVVSFLLPAVVGSGSIIVTATNAGGSDSQTISYTVEAVNSPPVINSVVTETFTAQISAADPDGDTLSYDVTTQGQHGTASVDSAGLVTYTAGVTFTGSDKFVITVSDGNGGTATVKMSISSGAGISMLATKIKASFIKAATI